MALKTSRGRPRHIIFRAKAIRLSVSVFVLMVLGGLALASAPWIRLPEDMLRVWFFDIGQGDAIFIETPTGEQILIDSGRDRRVLSKLGWVMPPWDRTLDAIVLTHPDADHVGGFADVLARYDVAVIYETGISDETEVMRVLEEAINREEADHRRILAGDRLVFGDVVLETVWPLSATPGSTPKNSNAFSIVFRLTFGTTSVALTGDAEAAEEARFASALGDADVLKAGHHGSKTSSDAEFLFQIRPEIAIISAGVGNIYGHPAPEVLGRLARAGATIFRTDLDGDILLTSSGGEPVVQPHPLPF